MTKVPTKKVKVPVKACRTLTFSAKLQQKGRSSRLRSGNFIRWGSKGDRRISENSSNFEMIGFPLWDDTGFSILNPKRIETNDYCQSYQMHLMLLLSFFFSFLLYTFFTWQYAVEREAVPWLSKLQHVLFLLNDVKIRGHTLLWVYRQLIAMPYIALARQAWIYRNISVTIGRLRS